MMTEIERMTMMVIMEMEAMTKERETMTMFN